jgi:hypothetical protein
LHIGPGRRFSRLLLPHLLLHLLVWRHNGRL